VNITKPNGIGMLLFNGWMDDFFIFSYNLKRKVAELAPVTSEQFDMKAQAAAAEKMTVTKSTVMRCMDCNKTFGTSAALDNHYQSKKHKEHMDGRSERVSTSEVNATTEEDKQEKVCILYYLFHIFLFRLNMKRRWMLIRMCMQQMRIWMRMMRHGRIHRRERMEVCLCVCVKCFN
jgi:hypothetical protein